MLAFLGTAGALAIVAVSAANTTAAARVTFRSATDTPASGATVIPLLAHARGLPTHQREVVVLAGDLGARWFLPDAMLWLDGHGYSGRLTAERLPPTVPSRTLYDDTELVFGRHRICSTGKVGAVLVLRTWAAPSAPTPPGLRLIAQQASKQKNLFGVLAPSTLALYQRLSGDQSHIRLACRPAGS